MTTYNQLLFANKKSAEEEGITIDELRLFLFELCNEKDINLYLEKDKSCDAEIEKKFNDGLKRLLKHEPLNYVLGYSYFYGYKMIVSKDVLIPRFETEELVGLILAKYDEFFPKKKLVLADIGTGSGAIAIALKKEEANFEVYASDISLDALKVAKENASNNEANINFLAGSMLDPFIEKDLKLDILVSNPPYIPSGEKMEASVVDYEPHVALFGGEDGLKFYREIFEKAHLVLNDQALLFFEIAYNQKESLSNLARNYFPNSSIEVYKDINKKDRMLFINYQK